MFSRRWPGKCRYERNRKGGRKYLRCEDHATSNNICSEKQESLSPEGRCVVFMLRHPPAPSFSQPSSLLFLLPSVLSAYSRLLAFSVFHVSLYHVPLVSFVSLPHALFAFAVFFSLPFRFSFLSSASFSSSFRLSTACMISLLEMNRSNVFDKVVSSCTTVMIFS